MHRILHLVLKALLVILSLATGVVKAFVLVPEDVAIFAAVGFPLGLTMAFGGLQIVGGLLVIPAKTQRLGGAIMAATFTVATVALLVFGETIFGVVSVLFIALALSMFIPVRSNSSQPANA